MENQINSNPLSTAQIVTMINNAGTSYLVNNIYDEYRRQTIKKQFMRIKQNQLPLPKTALDVEVYEQMQKERNDKHQADIDANKQIELHNKTLHIAVINKIKELSGLNDTVPQQYREKVWAYAYEMGHSGGFREVAIYLEDIVKIFEIN